MLDLSKQHTLDGEPFDIYAYLPPNVWGYIEGVPREVKEDELEETSAPAHDDPEALSDPLFRQKIADFRRDREMWDQRKAAKRKRNVKKKVKVKKEVRERKMRGEM